MADKALTYSPPSHCPNCKGTEFYLYPVPAAHTQGRCSGCDRFLWFDSPPATNKKSRPKDATRKGAKTAD